MGVFSLGAEAAALGNAEAVLLVGDHEAQGLELGGFGDQGVGAHCHLNFPAQELFPDLALFL